tara:strand:+ start:5357 stop:6049 length:693 start_codon:yes stop_codon:yes gene_type:complete
MNFISQRKTLTKCEKCSNQSESSLRSFEPYLRDVVIYPRQINGSFGDSELSTRSTGVTLSNTLNFATPFWVKQNVNIKRFKVSISAGDGALCVYKYTSEATPLNPFSILTFTLVNQAPLTTFPTSGYQQIILSTPITLEPENIYIAIIVPASTLGVGGLSSRTLSGPTAFLDVNNFLGGSLDYRTRMCSMSLTGGGGALVGDVAPNTMTFVPNQPQAGHVEYLQLGLLNA